MHLVAPVLGPFAVVAVLAAVLAGALGGTSALRGALVAAVLVAVFLGSSPVLMDPVARRSPVLSLPVALVLFGAKAAAAMLLVAVFLDVGDVAGTVDRRALGLGVVGLAPVWSLLLVRAFRRQRIATYDLDDPDR